MRKYKSFLSKMGLDFKVLAEPTRGLAAADAYLGSEDCITTKHTHTHTYNEHDLQVASIGNILL